MTRVDLVAAAGALLLFATIVELVRRRRLREEYALLWILTSLSLLVLSAWRFSLELLALAIGIFYPPSALFLIGFCFVLVILLHFSTVISRLADENKTLAQRYAVLEWELRQLRTGVHASQREGAERGAGEPPDPAVAGAEQLSRRKG